jgi:hypothetical protein
MKGTIVLHKIYAKDPNPNSKLEFKYLIINPNLEDEEEYLLGAHTPIKNHKTTNAMPIHIKYSKYLSSFNSYLEIN